MEQIAGAFFENPTKFCRALDSQGQTGYTNSIETEIDSKGDAVMICFERRDGMMMCMYSVLRQPVHVFPCAKRFA